MLYSRLDFGVNIFAVNSYILFVSDIEKFKLFLVNKFELIAKNERAIPCR